MRITKGADYTLVSPTFVGTDGQTPTDATGTPTCGVTREDGTILTGATVTHVSDGSYTAALTASTHTNQCDSLTVTWTGTVSGNQQVYRRNIEVVGGHYVEIADLMTEDAIGGDSRITVQKLEKARDWFEDIVEKHCGVAFVLRYKRDRLNGNGGYVLPLSKLYPQDLLSVVVNGTTQTLANFDLYDHGEIVWRTSWWPYPDVTNGGRNCKIAYEHADWEGIPDAFLEIAPEVIRWRVLSRLSDRNPNFIRETGINGVTVQVSTADPKNGQIGRAHV